MSREKCHPNSSSWRHWMASCSCGGWSGGPEQWQTLDAYWRAHVRQAEAERKAEMAWPDL